MRIDNSAFALYMFCPLRYFERYEVDNSDVADAKTEAQGAQDASDRNDRKDGLVSIQTGGAGGAATAAAAVATRGIELDAESEGRDFGTRMHQLLHERRLLRLGLRRAGQQPVTTAVSDGRPDTKLLDGAFIPAPDWPNEDIESECQSTLAGYEAHYVRDFKYLESERTHVLPLHRSCPRCGGEGLEAKQGLELREDQRLCRECSLLFTIHELVVKLDAVVCYDDATIGPMDTKTEGRPGYNTREDWAGRTQAKIYLYALSALYPEQKVSRLTVDVVTRGSPKARRGPVFTRIDDIASTPEAIQEAIRNVNWVADDIEHAQRTGWWRSNMNLCKRGWEKCDFYDLHVLGRTSKNLAKYRKAEQYLDL